MKQCLYFQIENQKNLIIMFCKYFNFKRVQVQSCSLRPKRSPKLIPQNPPFLIQEKAVQVNMSNIYI